METVELQQRLEKLRSDKLIDVVKNYRQYGYTESVRTYALSLLEQRGISQNDLLMTGNLENKRYEFATGLLAAFNRNSGRAFFFYLLVLAFKAAGSWSGTVGAAGTILATGMIAASVLYFLFLVKSFLAQSDFYEASGERYGSDGALTYLLLGLPFYFIMYFVFRNQMKERLQSLQ
jgi:hypothetical protein